MKREQGKRSEEMRTIERREREYESRRKLQKGERERR